MKRLITVFYPLSSKISRSDQNLLMARSGSLWALSCPQIALFCYFWRSVLALFGIDSKILDLKENFRMIFLKLYFMHTFFPNVEVYMKELQKVGKIDPTRLLIII